MRAMNLRTVQAFVIVLLLCGCLDHRGATRTATLTDWDLYRRIRIGMTESEVESVAGKPHAPVSHGLAFYGSHPVEGYDPYGSRSVPFNVIVSYSHGRVVAKEIYSGPRVYQEGQDPFPFGNDEGATAAQRVP